MFLQIHTLVSYPVSLLNRDDAGLAKRIPFGNATRLRVSSQCLKRHWREDLTARLPDLPDGLRTRSFFTRAVLPRLVAGGLSLERAQALLEPLATAMIKGGVDKNGDMSQPVLFGLREADYFVTLIQQCAEGAADTAAAVKALAERLKSADEKKNLAAMSKAGAGLTAALFGRFVTSDMLARVDAPVHVAHAFTVHAADTEMDYFTVVDDLNRDDETGAAHANQTELGAGVYYGHVAVDVPLLVSNLSGCARAQWKQQDSATAASVLQALVRSIASRSPGAKLGSTAPYSRAELVLLEAGTEQPRTLANAFLEALKPSGHVLQTAAERMAGQLSRIDAMYGPTAATRTLATTLEPAAFAPLVVQPLDEATRGALAAVWA
ncbi:MAG: type I-E CRISPR-associated protein Cas7/Cse4/CasC [Gammaproteobacteria bacterium]